MKTLLTNTCAQLAIAMTLVACNPSRPPVTSSPQPDALPASPIIASPSPQSTAIANPFVKGVDKAASATQLTQSAQTTDDWRLVVSQWERAIAFMKAVPPSSPNYKASQKLLPSYQQALIRTQQQAKRGGTLPSSSVAQGSAEGGVPLIAGDQSGASPDVSKDAVKTMEAAITISALLQQQQQFFVKQKRFASSLTELGTSIPASTPNYSYSTGVKQAKQVIATATAKQDGIPSYTGAILFAKDDKNNATPVAAVCFTTPFGRTPPPPPQLIGKDAQCPAGSTKM
ncbi:hypothetical protein H6F86_13500 [Phormidium sp. FACHB-592]|uniref:Type IV pilin-like G/H family protein n=1 Tax=Stenomitos frigidus AS-A4 TaxID=2933935 RepID=A0ABV0KMV7_9CYAN|nr:type IV pilin-like G/H family protein [Phormidium sp. FACHB-592]MBD2074892.1 hypothetical protein [Phormidium sp. FACHB-592]